MMDKVSQQQIQALIDIDIYSLINAYNRKEDLTRDEFNYQITRQAWDILFDEEKLIEKDIEIIEKFTNKEDNEGAMKYIREKVDKFDVKYLRASLQAKKIVIIDFLDHVITYQKGKEKEGFQIDQNLINTLSKLLKLAIDDNWQEFINYAKKLDD